MDLKRWFILLEGQVSGPWSDQEIESRIDTGKETLIWGRGQAEWLSPERWRGVLKNMETQASLEKQQHLWKVKVGPQELSPMSFEEMLENLKEYSDLSNIRVWAEGYEDWREVFQVRKIMDELGISRRKHPRVPIMGSLKGDVSFGELNARVISISEGGIGVNSAKGLKIGEKFQGDLSSPNLFVTVSCTMEVVYIGAEGYAGMRFMGLGGEAKSAIIEYVKKFQQTH